MKKLINHPAVVVEEMVDGLVAVFPGMRRLAGQTVLVRTDIPDRITRRVAVISGGGSGHEPAHAGYVGRGMLSAAVAGDVFTSPSPDAILAAIRTTAGPAGALLIIKNYTGDRLNFGLAAELARAESIPVETVLVADDVALAASGGHAGRRGLAGTILVHKIAGAVAESGATLTAVAAAARAAAGVVRSMGLALSSCTVPAAGLPGFTLAESEIELGLGIHGEPGVRRGPLEPADALVDCLLDTILTDLALAPSARVVLLINNLGATPMMELAVVARHAVAVLEGRGTAVERAYLGTFLSALDMAGVSLSVLTVDDERLAYLDAPTDAPAWPNAAARPRRRSAPPVEAPPRSCPTIPPAVTRPQTTAGMALESAILTATQALIEAGARLTAMDQVVGDGDLGISLERGSKAVQQELPTYPLDDPAAALHALAVTLQRSVGGTAGPLYAVFFLRASASLGQGAADDAQTWATAFRAGCTAIAELGGAAAGDRTMLDALLPAVAAFQEGVRSRRSRVEALRSAADAAAEGVRATANMAPRCGRSSYLGERVLGYPDPGAEAIAVVLDALARVRPVR
jgi:triose/dihydroxyacetone kinase / FAD-AMP lyase (cyclizing)